MYNTEKAELLLHFENRVQYCVPTGIADPVKNWVWKNWVQQKLVVRSVDCSGTPVSRSPSFPRSFFNI